jgi:uncharacterized membrane protein YwzB
MASWIRWTSGIQSHPQWTRPLTGIDLWKDDLAKITPHRIIFKSLSVLCMLITFWRLQIFEGDASAKAAKRQRLVVLIKHVISKLDGLAWSVAGSAGDDLAR